MSAAAYFRARALVEGLAEAGQDLAVLSQLADLPRLSDPEVRALATVVPWSAKELRLVFPRRSR